MMKIITFTILGALFGTIFIGGIVYFSGYLFQTMGIQLYHSESDQQRNFNIAFIVWIIFTIVGAWLGYKIEKKGRAP